MFCLKVQLRRRGGGIQNLQEAGDYFSMVEKDFFSRKLKSKLK